MLGQTRLCPCLTKLCLTKLRRQLSGPFAHIRPMGPMGPRSSWGQWGPQEQWHGSTGQGPHGALASAKLQRMSPLSLGHLGPRHSGRFTLHEYSSCLTCFGCRLDISDGSKEAFQKWYEHKQWGNTREMAKGRNLGREPKWALLGPREAQPTTTNKQ